MKGFIRRAFVVSAFLWDGNPETVKKNVPKADLKKYFKCFDTISGYQLAVYTFDGHEWEYPIGNTVVIRGPYGYCLCDPKWFNRLYQSNRNAN